MAGNQLLYQKKTEIHKILKIRLKLLKNFKKVLVRNHPLYQKKIEMH